MTSCSLCGALSVLFIALISVSSYSQDQYDESHLAQARALHARALVLDTHSDVTPKLENPEWDFSARHDSGHMDIPRMKDAGFGAEFFSIYMGRTPGDGRALKTAITRIDALMQTIEKHPSELALATTVDEIRAARRSGRIACLMGIEGGHIIEDSLPGLRTLFRLGCRYMTLTHSFNTSWADSSGTNSDVVGESGGLNEFGREIVREMNRLGMMVDISHVSDSTFWAALKTSKAPLIASHSSVDGVFPHRRNLSDEMLRGLADNGGIVMINFFNGYIDPEYDGYRKAWEAKHRKELDALAAKFEANRRAYWNAVREIRKTDPIPRTSMVVLARHVEHCAKVMGWDSVGLGADWDGVSGLPEGIDHCGDLVKLTALLLARGASEAEVEGFLGANFLRVMGRCEEVAKEIRGF